MILDSTAEHNKFLSGIHTPESCENVSRSAASMPEKHKDAQSSVQHMLGASALFPISLIQPMTFNQEQERHRFDTRCLEISVAYTHLGMRKA